MVGKIITAADTDASKRDFIGKTLLYGAALAGISRKVLAQEEQRQTCRQDTQ